MQKLLLTQLTPSSTSLSVLEVFGEGTTPHDSGPAMSAITRVEPRLAALRPTSVATTAKAERLLRALVGIRDRTFGAVP